MKLYGLYSGNELMYVDTVGETTMDWCDKCNYHLNILSNGGQHENDLYKFLLEGKEEGKKIYMMPIHEVPGMDVESVRRALVYALRPIGNWEEWREEEEREE